MASLYRQKKSGFWWIKFRDPARPVFDRRGNEVPRRESTGLKVGSGSDYRAARQLVADRSAAESRLTGGAPLQRWKVWVAPFLKLRYRRSAQSLLRYEIAWKSVAFFLEEHDVNIPRQLTRQHCLDYFAWREKSDVGNGKYNAGHNTALLEIKLLGLVMKEAVLRNFAPANPARELGIKRDAVRKPCEFTDADLQEIDKAIDLVPEPDRTMLRRSSLIARCHGVRLSETCVNPMRDVVLGPDPAITFHQKGGKVRTKPLHPSLIPLFAELQKAQAQVVFERPKSFAKEWHNFFKRAGLKTRLPNACFHSFRVTVENRLRRGGIEKALRMEYLSHEAKDVNSGYDRFTLAELRACHALL